MSEPSTAAAPIGVSIVLPVLNEERHLAEAVHRLLRQDYEGPFEIVLALGPSRDRTDEIAAALVSADSRVRTVPNPSGRTPEAMNRAIAAASHDVIVRIDGHSLVPDDYISTAVEVLERTGADNVGGIMAAEGVTEFEKAVARAMTTKLGVGAAAFHVGGDEGPALTVYLGCFRRSSLERVGGYDEAFTRAQDWEMNYRIRETGGVVWFTPQLQVTYRPRSTLCALARQYFEYGQWRHEVSRVHRGTLSLRYLAPPVAVLGVLVGSIFGLCALVFGNRWLAFGWLAPAGYLTLVVVGSILSARRLSFRSLLALPVVFATMHGAWGIGFLTSRRRTRVA